MKETLANIISTLLVFKFKYFKFDIENLFSNVHFLLQILSTKWNGFGGKMQISKTSGPPHELSCDKETSGGENINIDTADASLIVNGLGIVGGLENNGKIKGFCEEDFLGMFDEEEPSFDEIKETFGVFDANSDGFIDGSELQIVLCNLGVKCNFEECNLMIKPFDVNGDGMIDFREFVKLMENCLC